jgi:hypothetical protein
VYLDQTVDLALLLVDLLLLSIDHELLFATDVRQVTASVSQQRRCERRLLRDQ